MPAPARSRPLRKDDFTRTFRTQKATALSETSRPSSIPPNIRHLSWSPTGLALSTATNSKIRVWNPDRPSVKSSQELTGHTGTVERVEWNPLREGELASTGTDGTLRLWDVRVGPGAVGAAGRSSCVQDVKLGDGGLFLGWHPSGQQIVVGRRDDVVVVADVRMGLMGNVEALEPREGSRKVVSGQVQMNQFAFSNSGREMFATTGEGTVKVLDWPSMSLLHTLNAHTASAYSVQHSPSGNFLAVGGGDSLITLWDTHDWVCKHTLSAMTGSVHSLSFSFDGTYIVGAHGTDRDGDKGLEVACAQTGEYIHKFDTQNVASVVAWHPVRYWLAYAGDPGGVKVLGLAGNL